MASINIPERYTSVKREKYEKYAKETAEKWYESKSDYLVPKIEEAIQKELNKLSKEERSQENVDLELDMDGIYLVPYTSWFQKRHYVDFSFGKAKCEHVAEVVNSIGGVLNATSDYSLEERYDGYASPGNEHYSISHCQINMTVKLKE